VLIGKTLAETRLGTSTGLIVLALVRYGIELAGIWREGAPIGSELADEQLGDGSSG